MAKSIIMASLLSFFGEAQSDLYPDIQHYAFRAGAAALEAVCSPLVSGLESFVPRPVAQRTGPKAKPRKPGERPIEGETKEEWRYWLGLVGVLFLVVILLTWKPLWDRYRRWRRRRRRRKRRSKESSTAGK